MGLRIIITIIILITAMAICLFALQDSTKRTAAVFDTKEYYFTISSDECIAMNNMSEYCKGRNISTIMSQGNNTFILFDDKTVLVIMSADRTMVGKIIYLDNFKRD